MNIEDIDGTEIDDEIDADPDDGDDDLQDQNADAGKNDDSGDDDTLGDDDEIVIEIEGEEPDAANETPAIRQLREANRTQARRIAELEAKDAPGEIQIGEKPTLESCEWDEERFENELVTWQERKRAKERAEQERVEQERKSAELWNGIESKYRAGAAQLRVPGFEEKERKVDTTLPEIVRRAIKAYCDEPAKVIAALGTNDALLDRIASEKDPIKQLVTLVKLEGKMKVKRSRQIEPDKPLNSSAPLEVSSVNKQREKLEKEAARTGDRTELIAFNKAQRDKKA